MQYRAIANLVGFVLLPALVAAAPAPMPSPQTPEPRVTVFKDPNCGCCKSWIEHLRRHGFEITVRDTADISGAKRTGRVPEALHACHTAFVGGYVVEGHVPAADVRRLLAERPPVAGIAVAGMPLGSPGMEAGNRVEHYDVIAFNRDGTTRVFARH